MNTNGRRDYVAETRADFADFDRAVGLNDAEMHRRYDDEAQQNSLRRWSEKNDREGSGGFVASWPTVIIGVGLLLAEIAQRWGAW